MAERDRTYDSFEGFLRTVLESYWETGRDRANFLALLLASREAWQVAWEKTAGSPQKLATGAAGVAGVALLVRTVLGGPLGLLLTGASAASLISLYARRKQRIGARADRYRGLIDAYRNRYQRVQTEYLEGALDRERRDLMIDGWIRRMLEEIDRPLDGPEEESDRSNGNGFARHVARSRGEESR